MKSRLPGPWLVLIAPFVLFLLHACFYRSYGIFRDEFYYFVSGLRPAWGYVDQPPLVAWISYALSYLFQQDLSLYRFWSFAASAAHLALVLAWVRKRKGGALAQTLVAVAVIMAPLRLGMDHFFSMNSLEPLLWFAMFWLFPHVGSLKRHELLGLGILIGIGILNKHTTVLYAALLSVCFFWNTPNRARYAARIAFLAFTSLVIISPHLLWQMREGWPTLEFMEQSRLYKNEALTALSLLGELILYHHPLAAFLWLPGLFVLLTRSRWHYLRPYAWAVLAFGVILIPAHGKSYYAASLMAPLLAIGALEFESLGLRGRWAFPVLIGLSGLVMMPLSLPVLPVAMFQSYQELIGFQASTGEKQIQGTLPQHYADMFGWEEMARFVATAYDELPDETRDATAVLTQNYGEAGALDYYGRHLGLPPASSGHNNYFLWGFQPEDATQLLILGGLRENHEKICGTLSPLGEFDHPLRMPYERHLVLYLCQDFKRPLNELWPLTRKFI